MKKICFISNLFPSKDDPTFGSFVGLNYQQLKNMGYELAEPIVINARVGAFKKILAYIKFFFTGLKAILSNKYDFFYIHYLTYSTLCLLPILPFKKVKYLVNIHGDDLVGTRLIHKVMGLPSAFILKRATAVVVPSLYFKRQLLARHAFVDEDKVIISESAGFREDFFYPPKTQVNELIAHNDNLHFGYISRVDEGKGWELMLAAFALLKEKNPTEYANSRLSVYGAGAQVPAFNAMVLQLGLSDVVTYYGPLAQYKLGDVYRSFDYFLFPTRRESFGLVAVEALACGTPVICSAIEPLTDVVKDSYNGYLFNDGSEKSLYQKLEYCFSIATSDYSSLTKSSVLSVKHLGAKEVCKELYKELTKRFSS